MKARWWVGLDPSITAFGYAVMYQFVGGQPCVQQLGTWKTSIDDSAKKLDDRARRVRELGVKLVALFDEVILINAGNANLPEVYTESLALGMKTSCSTAQTLGRVRGLLEGICIVRGLELAEVRPEILKQAVTGRKDASKEEVARIVRRAYPNAVLAHMDLNATDALAVAHVGAYRFGHGLNVTSGVVKYEPSVDDAMDF